MESGRYDPAVYEIAGATVINPPPDWKYPSPAVYVKSDAGIEKPADLRGKTVADNFGGNIYAGYLDVLALGGLTEKDITPQLFESNQLAATAFNTGDTQAVVSSYSSIKAVVDSGKAKLLIGNVSSAWPAAPATSPAGRTERSEEESGAGRLLQPVQQTVQRVDSQQS